jgi:hypothetical protein
LTTALVTGSRSAAIPLLLVGNGLAPQALIDTVTRFLGESGSCLPVDAT